MRQIELHPVQRLLGKVALSSSEKDRNNSTQQNKRNRQMMLSVYFQHCRKMVKGNVNNGNL